MTPYRSPPTTHHNIPSKQVPTIQERGTTARHTRQIHPEALMPEPPAPTSSGVRSARRPAHEPRSCESLSKTTTSRTGSSTACRADPGSRSAPLGSPTPRRLQPFSINYKAASSTGRPPSATPPPCGRQKRSHAHPHVRHKNLVNQRVCTGMMNTCYAGGEIRGYTA